MARLKAAINVLKILLVAILIATMIMSVVTYIWPKQTAVFIASHLIGRATSIGQISVNLNHSLNFELTDVHISNPSWASTPDMVDIGHLSGSLDLPMFLSGRFMFTNLRIDDATLTLERNSEGLGNWKNPGVVPRTPLSPEEEAHESRKKMPVVLNLIINNDHIIMHTSSGAVLTVDLNKVALQTASSAQPVTLTAEGAYNKLPVQLKIETQSFDVLHDVDRPLEAKIMAQGEDIDAKLDLQLMDPINVDLATGKMHVDIKDMGTAAAYIGSKFNAKWPLVFDAQVERRDDHWGILSAEGKFAGNSFSNSDFKLDEGKRLQPDKITTAFVFASINSNSFNSKQQKYKPRDKIEWLNAGKNPDTLVEADLTIGKAVYQSTIFSDIHLQGGITKGESGLRAMTFHVFGGDASGSLISTINGQINQIKTSFALTHLHTDQALQNLTTGKKIIDGDVDITARATSEGDTVPTIAHNLDGHIELRMAAGNVRSWVNHLAAQDIRALFDSSTKMTPVQCINAYVSFIHGVGQLSPFILQTSDGSLIGQGSIDLPQNKIALLFRTNPKTTSALALDLPVFIHGNINNPKVGTGVEGFSQPLEQTNKFSK